MVHSHTYPLLPSTFHNCIFSSFFTSCRYLKFPNKFSPFITHSSFQNPFAKLQHPDEKSPPLFKTNFWVNPINPKAKQFKLAKTLNSCDPNEDQVYEIIFKECFGCNLTERNACFILNNMSKTDNAMIVFRYFMPLFEPVKLICLYNAMLKLFRESKEFEKAEKLFDEMLQRMVKPNVITFSTMISCAILCSMHHKAVEWFEMMPSFECEPNDNISSSVISSYARIGNVDRALKLYRRAKKEKWKVENMVFLSLIKMYGKSANYDACLSVYRDMKVFGVKPNMTIYNNLLCAMGRGKRASEAKAIYEEMINNGISPNQSTYEAVLQAYCRGLYKVDALSVYKEMKEKGMDIGKVLYHMLLDMCVDVGYIDEAVEIFEDMQRSGTCQPENTLKLKHPDANSSPFLKNSFLLRLAKTLNSCDPNEDQVYEIIKGFDYNVTERNACFILNNISKTDNAMLVFRYFMPMFEPVKLVFPYNVMLKMFRESKEFEKAEQLFDEMLQRMVKPNVITFSTMISCAILCSMHHKAVEWFEMMPSFECEPNDNISSSVISPYARIGNVDTALKLYRRAKKEKWKVEKMVFSSLIKMYGKSANYVACLTVYRDMKVFGVKPNVTIYNNMLCAMGRGKRAWEAKAIYEEMINNGISPNQSTYEAVLQAYCRGLYKVDALSVYKEMKEKGMDIGKVLYHMLLDMCADVGYVDEAVEIFQDMKSSGTCHPDSVTYTSLINMYSRIGNVSEAEAMLNEMMNCGFEPNILVLTSLASCYGKGKRTDVVVRIFNQLLDLGISPDDRFCDCLLYVMTQLPKQEHGKITDCIQKANPMLGFVVRYLMEERDGDGNFRKEASELFNSIDDFAIKKSMCNSLIDLCVNMELLDRACDLLNLGLTLEIYTNVQNRSQTKWSLYVKSLSTGTALTALHVWINDLSKALESGGELPPVLGIYTGRKNKSSPSVIESYLIEHNAPFQNDNDMAGWFLTTSEAVKPWLQSRKTDAPLDSRVLCVPTMVLSH